MLGGADNPNGELLSYIIGADIIQPAAWPGCRIKAATVVWKVPGNWLFTRILFWFMRSTASGEKCISCEYCILHRSGHRGAVRI